MEKNGQKHRRRLVLLPCPFQGHINPMLQLGSFLHSKGFSITVIHCKFNSPNPSNHPSFEFIPFQDGLSGDDISSGDLVRIIQVANVGCKSHLQECLSQIMTQRRGGQNDDVACIIHDELLYISQAVANSLKLPSIVLRTTSAATFLARTAILTLEGYIPFQGIYVTIDSASQDPVPGFHLLRFKDLPVPRSKTLCGFEQLVVDSYNIGTSSAIVWNTMESLELSLLEQIQQQCQVPVLPVGPVHKFAPASYSSSLLEEDTSCMSWLGKQTKNSVIYVSMGSIASMDEKELAEMAWGLANSQQPFLWVIRPGSNSYGSDQWIEELPKVLRETLGEKGCIVKWAPQKEVLAHSAVGGFLSHCGWNSTLESICEGVPMICRPSFGDQKVNARYLSHVWRVGLELEELERGQIEKAVRKLMVDKEGEVVRENANNLKGKVELCIREGGSSDNSLNRLADMIMSF
ncbi:UDP-glucose iridoid glucosyltransferase-like isoform X1 [Juglans microcarpa x Juglans regia]|uniref:UDP-glucose iridoid glucosyltransferase-like isoform X1 n=1 Tax=Juglans microcarpa x Juglans regia TaxID=2249226 RepID=UPI001B7F2A64|nr:UDP-glucose iridoid glucosyltransferase-like isoform X1 [Juglans microcarpa x Juglans regia]